MSSQIQKLNYIDNKLGANTSGGQQTTRVIFDTYVHDAATMGINYPSVVNFFKDGNKPSYQTNLPTGKLDSGEAMVIKEVCFQYTSSPSSYLWPSNLDGRPALVSVKVGNQVVIKDFQIGPQTAAWSGPYERMFSGDSSSGYYSCAFRCLTDIILPPQVNVEVSYQLLVPNGTVQNPSIGRFTCFLKGYGVLFNAGTSF